jgi:hypothetical protein
MKVERTFASLDEIGEPVFESTQVYFPNSKSSLYLKSKSWGLTGDHKITVISTKRELEFQPDSISEYIFHGFGDLIYKTQRDTLKIYSMHKPTIPTDFQSEIYVELIEIKSNPEWTKLEEKLQNGYRQLE